jgi:uncharacterized protein (TIGR02597 family)
MKTPQKIISLLAGSALAAATFLNAATTDPVGYVTATTPNGDDALIGVPLTQNLSYAGNAVSVSTNVITISSTVVADSFAGTHYLLATSGSNTGQWSSVTANTTSEITTEDPLISQGDTINIFPFWTLSTLFPGGAGVGASANPSLPTSVVLINNLEGEGVDLSSAASYFYYVGTEGVPAGWYQTGVFTPSDDLILSPETYLTVRNETGASITTVFSGAVPTNPVGTKVLSSSVREQDNQLTNPYPAAITLANSGLTNVVQAAANPSLPEDTVLIYNNDTSSGQDISVEASYLYYAGSQGVPAGWYQTGVFTPSDDVEIPAGGAFIVRKGIGSDELVKWVPPLPYAL